MNQEKINRKEWIQGEGLSVGEPLETESFDVGIHYHVECIMDQPGVKFHLFRYGKTGWPADMKELIIAEMDARISDDYTAAYEDVADSWFIGIPKFCEARLTARHMARSLIQDVVEAIAKKEIERGSIRVPGA